MEQHTNCRKHTLTQEIKQIAESYVEAMAFLNTKYNPFNGDKKADECELFVIKVRRAYLKLDGLEQRFIHNEFFSTENPRWWERFYKKATFYRIRLQSMKHFKEIFDNEE